MIMNKALSRAGFLLRVCTAAVRASEYQVMDRAK